MRTTGLLLALLLSPLAATAAPERYALDLGQTQVGFTWYLGKDPVEGRMPVSGADVTLDFAMPERTDFTVTLDATKAQAGFIFATQAMQGPKMLDTGDYPEIAYRAARITRDGEEIRAEGEVTIRGVTKPIAMTARFFRPADQPPGDRSHLVVLLDGTLDRNDFGASGWREAVGPSIDLHIRAVLDRMR